MTLCSLVILVYLGGAILVSWVITYFDEEGKTAPFQSLIEAALWPLYFVVALGFLFLTLALVLVTAGHWLWVWAFKKIQRNWL